MTRTCSITLAFLAAGSMLLAQEQGGWRRFGDTAPAPTTPAAQAAAPAEAQDPAQPVDRSEAHAQQPAPNFSNYAPPYSVPAQLTIKPGTFVNVRVDQMLSSNRNQPGDVFQATLMQPVVVDGVVVAQRGQAVMGRVAEAQRSRAGHDSRLGLELISLTLVDGTQAPLRSQLAARRGPATPGSQQVGAVATTTAVGAAVGAMADWGRGAAIGAGAGAAAGIIGVLLTRNQPTVVYPETALTFRIDAPLTVDTTRAPQAFRYVDPNDYSRAAEARPVPVRRPTCRYGYGCGAGPYYGPGYYPYWGPGYGIGIGWGVRRGRWGRW
jgi:hypothetical protein